MIGAILAKRKVSAAFDALSRQDIDAFLANFDEDATLSSPNPIGSIFPPPHPTLEGKESIREWCQKFIEQWEFAYFIIKNICVKRHCPFAFNSNVVTVEWDLKLINKGEAKENSTSGVTVVDLKWGKATEVRVYECVGDPVLQVVGPKPSED